METFIYDYFIRPIWERTGYNLVNTFVYAIIAILAVYVLYRVLKRWVTFDTSFIVGVLSFVLFGSTVRVVTDSIDTGVFKPVTFIHAFVLSSHIWDYGYFTVTPGIYVVTAALLLASIAVLRYLGRMNLLPYVGLALWFPHFVLLLPFASYAIYALPVLLLALIPGYLAYLYFRKPILAAVVTGQALDGAATFFVIDIFSQVSGMHYFEQHVLSAGIGTMTGTYFSFYLLKVAISFGAAYLLSKEDGLQEQDKNYLALILMIMGFAPGIRDVLRMMLGA